MKHPVPPLSLLPLLLLIPAAAPAAPSPEDIARQQEQRQRQREEQLREHMQPAGHVRLDGGETPVAAPTSGHDAASQPCFPIRRVELTGEGAAQFRFALRTALKQSRFTEGQCLGAEDINRIMTLAHRIANPIKLLEHPTKILSHTPNLYYYIDQRFKSRLELCYGCQSVSWIRKEH